MMSTQSAVDPPADWGDVHVFLQWYIAQSWNSNQGYRYTWRNDGWLAAWERTSNGSSGIVDGELGKGLGSNMKSRGFWFCSTGYAHLQEGGTLIRHLLALHQHLNSKAPSQQAHCHIHNCSLSSNRNTGGHLRLDHRITYCKEWFNRNTYTQITVHCLPADA
jgi:hypothetical protein